MNRPAVVMHTTTCCINCDHAAGFPSIGGAWVLLRDGLQRALSCVTTSQLPRRLACVHPPEATTIDASAIKALKEQGLGATEIAKRLKISRASVYRVLEERA